MFSSNIAVMKRLAARHTSSTQRRNSFQQATDVSSANILLCRSASSAVMRSCGNRPLVEIPREACLLSSGEARNCPVHFGPLVLSLTRAVNTKLSESIGVDHGHRIDK